MKNCHPPKLDHRAVTSLINDFKIVMWLAIIVEVYPKYINIGEKGGGLRLVAPIREVIKNIGCLAGMLWKRNQQCLKKAYIPKCLPSQKYSGIKLGKVGGKTKTKTERISKFSLTVQSSAIKYKSFFKTILTYLKHLERFTLKDICNLSQFRCLLKN